MGAPQPRILELTGRLWSGLANQGFVSAYHHGASPQSGILSVRKPGVDIDHLSAKLNQRGFVTRVRLNHLLLAPHIYQSPEQMDATVAAIAERGDQGWRQRRARQVGPCASTSCARPWPTNAALSTTMNT